MQLIRLTGVLDDGSPRTLGVPADPARTLTLPEWNDVILEVAVIRPDGSEVDLQPAVSPAVFTCWLSVSRSPACARPDLQFKSTAVKQLTRNVVVFSLQPAALRRFFPGRLFYEVSLDFGGKRYQLVPVSALVVQPALRRA
jgi:hypothetical protein